MKHSMTRQSVYKIIFTSIGIFSVAVLFAQRDTSGKGGVEIISAFKPVLREAAKINFNPTPPPADDTKPKLTYEIPNQNLAFAYQPGSLKPLGVGY